jgi:hypothetical protein
MLKGVLVTVIALVSGCASVPVGPAYIEAPKPETRSDMAVFYLYRVYAEPTKMDANFSVDEKQAVSLPQRTFTWFYLTPGEHKFVFGWPFLAGMPSVPFSKNVDAGAVYVYEVTGDVKSAYVVISSETGLVPVPVAEAEKEMAACCRFVEPTAPQF